MKKKLVLVVTAILVIVVCLSALVGCDSSARNVKYLSCDDYLHKTGVSITMAKRLKKVGVWNSTFKAIKFDKSLAELFDLMKMQDGYVKTLHDDYILIEKEDDDKLYTWGIFSTTVLTDYGGEYQFVLTAMDCVVVESNSSCEFFFPIYMMERPTLDWNEGANYAVNMTIDELDEFYAQHGFTTELSDNVLIVSTPIKRGFNGYECYESWEITFQNDGTLSVGNFLTHETVYKW